MILGELQSFLNRIQNPLDINVHADPLRTRPAMAILAAADVRAFHANVFGIGTAISPPLGGPKQSNHRSSHRDCQMRRPCFAADVNLRSARQSTETLERNRNDPGLS